jgi:hypothetical protein
MRSYTYTLFKKQGKRVISSFPTVKDDRVKKPFAAFKQANFIRNGTQNFLTGEILNADDIPVNIALKAVLTFKDGSTRSYHPGNAFQYNLSPKASTFFQVELDSTRVLDSLGILGVQLYAETDVIERGYIHGGTMGFSVSPLQKQDLLIQASIYNELTNEINIPGILIAEKDAQGQIWQTRLALSPAAVRSGLTTQFPVKFSKIQHSAAMLKSLPIQLFINGQPRFALPVQPDAIANANGGISLLSHCFMSQEIYLQ